MMQVRCQRCGWTLTLGRESIALALAEAQQGHEQYHAMDCPHCRHVIKVRIADLRRRLPADYPLPEVAPPAAEPKPETKPEPAAEEKPAV
jgi:DNA-directed RNA polymerase subunit RPC12/RpoP